MIVQTVMYVSLLIVSVLVCASYIRFELAHRKVIRELDKVSALEAEMAEFVERKV